MTPLFAFSGSHMTRQKTLPEEPSLSENAVANIIRDTYVPYAMEDAWHIELDMLQENT